MMDKSPIEVLKNDEEALRQAHDVRKFEIDLYWKRATYFWTFIAATFAGYFLILSNSNKISHCGIYLLLIGCIGYVFSFSWYLVNRGSKRWHENWEMIVTAIEKTPLYKTIYNKKYHWWNLNEGYPYSASKINQIVSLYIVVVWIILIFFTILNVGRRWCLNLEQVSFYNIRDVYHFLLNSVLSFIIYLGILVINILFTRFLLIKGKSGIQYEEGKGTFINSWD